MAAAMELSRAGSKCTIVEKASAVGGLSKTLEFTSLEGTYRTDIGPHRFFSKNRYLYDFIEDLLGEEWITVDRCTRFHVGGKYYSYPIRLGNVLGNLGPRKCWKVIGDFLSARLRAAFDRHPPRSFEDYAVSRFGRALAEFNMLNYTEKIWGLPCSQISQDWALQRIGGLSFGALLRRLVSRRGGPKSLVDTFYYPEFGTGTIYKAIADRIRATGSRVLLKSEPIAIHWRESMVTAVDVRTPQGMICCAPENVVSSIPITQVLSLLSPAPPRHVLDAAGRLRFRSQVYLFLTVQKERVSHDNWTYFPDKEIPFGRISEMKNFSPRMCPPGHTSLFVEFFCFEGDDLWTMDKDALAGLTFRWLERLGILSRADVRTVHHHRQANVYPLYDLQWRTNIRTVTEWLDSFENLFAIGRPGRFRYTNQDHSLEMGILAARSILDGRRYNVDDVGAEAEYFERGYSPQRRGLPIRTTDVPRRKAA